MWCINVAMAKFTPKTKTADTRLDKVMLMVQFMSSRHVAGCTGRHDQCERCDLESTVMGVVRRSELSTIEDMAADYIIRKHKDASKQ